MARWWEFLSRTDIFRNYLKAGKSAGTDQLTSTESGILVWAEERKCVLSINLRKLHIQLKNQDEDLVDTTGITHQLLLCTRPPQYDVTRIQVNARGDVILLGGRSSLMVMKLLRRKGLHGEYGGGHLEVVCVTIPVEVYHESRHNFIRRMEWLTDDEFIVLSADNTLRKFSTALPSQPMLSIGLSESVTSGAGSISAPGLDWVDFSLLDPSSLICLRDSGDLHLLRLGGPAGADLSEALPMRPAADDNYTLDASVVLVLQTAVRIVVIATPSGEIHHCILLPKMESSGMSSACLVVFERLRLESDIIKDYGSIQLFADPTMPTGYFFRHTAGVHRVSLPWAEHLSMQLSNQGGSDVMAVEGQADVKFLLEVTIREPESTEAPVLCGVCTTADTIIGHSLVCLASNGTCRVFPLQPIIPPAPFENAEETLDAEQRTLESVGNSQSGEGPQRSSSSDFVSRLAAQLRPGGGRALHHLEVPAPDRSQEECFRSLRDSTRRLTEDRLARQDVALVDLDVKKKSLVKFRQQQIDQVADIKEDVKQEECRFETIRKKLEVTQDRGVELVRRLRDVVCRLSTRSSELSHEERKFSTSMKTMGEDLRKMHQRMQTLKEKCRSAGYDLDKPPAPPSLTENQQEHTKTILKEQMSTIAQMVSDVKVLMSCMTVAPGEDDSPLLPVLS